MVHPVLPRTVKDATDPKGMGETLGIDHRICKAVQDYAVTRIKELNIGSGTITPHLKQETNDVAASVSKPVSKIEHCTPYPTLSRSRLACMPVDSWFWYLTC